MFEAFIVFEFLIGIAGMIALWICIYGLMDNNCWIFDSDYWVDKSKNKKLERKIEELEKTTNELERKTEELCRSFYKEE